MPVCRMPRDPDTSLPDRVICLVSGDLQRGIWLLRAMSQVPCWHGNQLFRCREDIPEALVDRVILKELKTAKEQLDTCPPDRTDLLEEYQLRYDVIQEYAPTMMSREEVHHYITEKFAKVVATKNKGQIKIGRAHV